MKQSVSAAPTSSSAMPRAAAPRSLLTRVGISPPAAPPDRQGHRHNSAGVPQPALNTTSASIPASPSARRGGTELPPGQRTSIASPPGPRTPARIRPRAPAGHPLPGHYCRGLTQLSCTFPLAGQSAATYSTDSGRSPARVSGAQAPAPGGSPRARPQQRHGLLP